MLIIIWFIYPKSSEKAKIANLGRASGYCSAEKAKTANLGRASGSCSAEKEKIGLCPYNCVKEVKRVYKKRAKLIPYDTMFLTTKTKEELINDPVTVYTKF